MTISGMIRQKRISIQRRIKWIFNQPKTSIRSFTALGGQGISFPSFIEKKKLEGGYVGLKTFLPIIVI